MKNKIIAVAAVVALSLGSGSIVNTAYANPTNDIHTKQSTIKTKREEIKKDLSKADAKIADILFDLKEINAEIAKVEKALKENNKIMNDTETKIVSTKEDIKVIKAEIIKLEESIEARNEVLKRRIASYQKSGGNIGFLEVILGSKNFTEFISRTTAVTKITNSDSELLEVQDKEKAEVEVQQGNLEVKLDEELDMLTELEGMKALILAQKDENAKSKKELKGKEKQLVALKSKLKSKDSSLAKELARLEEQVRQEIAAAKAAAKREEERQLQEQRNLVALAKQTQNKQAIQSVSNKSKAVQTQTNQTVVAQQNVTQPSVAPQATVTKPSTSEVVVAQPEPSVTETPVSKAPGVQEVPVAKAPEAQEVPVEKAPEVQEAPVTKVPETPVVNNTPKQEVSKPVSQNGNINVAINAGYNHLGTPYVWAGKGPGGFDCSGFVSWAFGQAGISIPSSTSGLSSTGTSVSYNSIQPGDIVYFDTYKVNGHVGIYVGNGQFIGAQNSTGLAVATMTSGYWKDKFRGHVRRVK